jgi:hypothetical protein
MKKLVVFLTFFSMIGFVSAQTIETSDFKKQNEVQTVMNSIKIHRISGFGGPTMSYSTIKGEFAFMMGGGGGIIINNLFLGGYGEGLSNKINIGNDYSLRDLDFGHGGFWVGYELSPKSIIHPVISSRIGWGNISGYNTTENKFFADNVFVVIPTVSAEINFTRFFKINVGAEYRQTLNVNNISSLSNKDFSSLGVYMNFVFGWF